MLIIKEIARTYAIYKSYLKSINTLKTIGFSSKGIKNNFEYFELSNNKWKKIKLNFLVKNLKIKIHYK